MSRSPDATTNEAQHFAERLSDIINAGATAVMLSIGHRLSLFETLAGMGPSTSSAIAQETALSERYVREWLAVMVVSRLVTYDPRSHTYSLPAHHAACLTQDGPFGNLAVYGQHVALLGKIEESVMNCMRSGAGLTYDDYPRFHEIMAEDSAQTVIAALFAHVIPLVEELEERLSAGIDVLDAGCGQGAALIAMAQWFRKSAFVGYDLSAEAVSFANKSARLAGLDNVYFETRDLCKYLEAERWDLITTFDAVHDQKDPAQFVQCLRGSLRDGGIYMMQDIGGSAYLEKNVDFPMAALLYAISCAHCTPVSLGQGGGGLGAMWG